MTTLFIADLHLEESRPVITDIFLKFLREEAAKAKALYILGDLFEVWIGDDDRSSFNQMILKALRQTTERGTPIYLMKGNRDFLMGRRFKRQTRCEMIPDEIVIDLYGKPTLLMHGDTLCTRDVKYLQFRKRTRKFWVQWLFLLKSLAKRKAMADVARQKSKEHTTSTAMDIMDVTPEEVERVMHYHHVFNLIHGHTHRPDVHHFLLNGNAATRTVLAPWHEHGSVLVCHPDGRQEMMDLR